MLYDELYDYARSWGLSRSVAEGYATLMWWGARYYGLQPAAIVSGVRDRGKQAALLREWQQFGSRGPNRIAVRPASRSAHLDGEAFDLENVPHRAVYGAWAPYAGLRWGGSFRTPDEPHFDSRA